MKPSPSGTPFIARVRVRFADTDAEGVVYYGSYLTYFEVARVELLRSLGLPVSEVAKRGVAFPAVAAECRYRRPGRVDELLDVRLWLGERRRSSFGFLYEVRRGDELLVSGSTTHACVDLRSGRPIRHPDWFAGLWEEAAAGQHGGAHGDAARVCAGSVQPAQPAGSEGGPRRADHTVIWRYVVDEEHRDEFERAYGAGGDWARFFASGDGYKTTRLLCDDSPAGGYVVIDVWESGGHYRRFLERHRDEYDRRSQQTATLYVTEERVGEFRPVALGEERGQ